MDGPSTATVGIGAALGLAVSYYGLKNKSLGFKQAECDDGATSNCVRYDPDKLVKPTLIVFLVCLLAAWFGPDLWRSLTGMMSNMSS